MFSPMFTPERLAEICAARGLTERQGRFVVEYMTQEPPRSPSAAYMVAYDVKQPVRSRWVLVQASKMLAHPKVGGLIDELKAKMLPAITQRAFQLAAVDESFVVTGLARIAENGLQQYEVERPDGRTTIEMVDRPAATRALELLGRRLGLWIDKREIVNPVLPPEVQERRERARRLVYDMLEKAARGEGIINVTPPQPKPNGKVNGEG